MNTTQMAAEEKMVQTLVTKYRAGWTTIELEDAAWLLLRSKGMPVEWVGLVVERVITGNPTNTRRKETTMTTNTTTETMREAVTGDLRRKAFRLEATMAKWAEDAAKDPVYALRRCGDAMESAATLDVLREVLRAMDRDPATVTLEVVAEELTSQVLRGAEYGTHRSTSGTSNVWEERRLMAVASLLREITADLRTVKADEARVAAGGRTMARTEVR